MSGATIDRRGPPIEVARSRVPAGRLIAACLVAGTAWAVVETGGGAVFLAAGIRLWRYDIAPLFAALTSPVVWVFAVTLIIPLSIAFERRWTASRSGAERLARLAIFLMITGSVLEVLINEFLFRRAIGQPLYEYLVLPTFGGSGSWLSPLYYATLLVHVPITDRLLGRP